MLKAVHPEDYEKAVIDICKKTKDMGRINFVAEVLEYVALHKGNRVSRESREERLLPPKDRVPIEDLQKLVKDFNANLKGMK